MSKNQRLDLGSKKACGSLREAPSARKKAEAAIGLVSGVQCRQLPLRQRLRACARARDPAKTLQKITESADDPSEEWRAIPG
jgi:hypothetical protein